MTDSNVEVIAENDGNTKKRRPRGRGPRGPRLPSLKDWIRVINSQSNGLPNVNVKLMVNQATGMCELSTAAPVQEGSEELEKDRIQVFHITHFEVINDAERDPFGKKE